MSLCKLLMFLPPRWQKLLNDSDARKQRLLRLQEQYRQIEDLYLTFAKKASAFNSWFENAEEDLTDPVRCNSVEEIRVLNHFVLSLLFYSIFKILLIVSVSRIIFWTMYR